MTRLDHVARTFQRAAIRRHMSSSAGRQHLATMTETLDVDGALTLLEEVADAPEEDRSRILRNLSARPEAVLRHAALRALGA